MLTLLLPLHYKASALLWKKAECNTKRGLLTTSPYTTNKVYHLQQTMSTKKSYKKKFFAEKVDRPQQPYLRPAQHFLKNCPKGPCSPQPRFLPPTE
jgi:hypothetical protein